MLFQNTQETKLYTFKWNVASSEIAMMLCEIGIAFSYIPFDGITVKKEMLPKHGQDLMDYFRSYGHLPKSIHTA